MEYDRKQEKTIISSLSPNKVLVIIGARRVGKTYLVKQISKQIKEDFLYLNGEDISTEEVLERRSAANYRNLLGDKKLLIIDEAQNLPGIGLKLKLMVDEIEGLKILVTGSSAFNISTDTGEPLTGRQKVFYLFPFAESELIQYIPVTERIDQLKVRLIYGNYPEVFKIKNIEDKANYLKEIVNSYLLKDILAYENIRNSSKILSLLKLIALQVGNEVSYDELGRQLSLHKNTVERYLDLLSKVFVLFKAGGFSRNLRKEVTKTSKWYFYDNGIRNTIIANFNNLESRNDVGALWENYMISERIKYQNINRMIVNNYFWRTYDRQEIDWIEERGGNLFGYEMKWSKEKVKTPAAFQKAYPDAEFSVVNKNNYQDWLT